MPQGPVSPPYFHSDLPLLEGKLTQRMKTHLKTHLKKLSEGKTTMKRDTYRLAPENYYNLRVWNDKTHGWNYEEMNRQAKQYIAEENARVKKRIRQAAKMNGIRKMKKKINDKDHRALLSSVLKNKPISRFIR